MMNINCSEKCIHEKNGNCTLNHVTPLSNIFDLKADCAYFIPRQDYTQKTPQK